VTEPSFDFGQAEFWHALTVITLRQRLEFSNVQDASLGGGVCAVRQATFASTLRDAERAAKLWGTTGMQLRFSSSARWQPMKLKGIGQRQ
jgi:hypothetical protein